MREQRQNPCEKHRELLRLSFPPKKPRSKKQAGLLTQCSLAAFPPLKKAVASWQEKFMHLTAAGAVTVLHRFPFSPAVSGTTPGGQTPASVFTFPNAIVAQ